MYSTIFLTCFPKSIIVICTFMRYKYDKSDQHEGLVAYDHTHEQHVKYK